MQQEKLYADRDIEAQGSYYINHILAMTREDLYSKSDIAAELAHRDIVITELLHELENLVQACEDNIEVPQSTYDAIRKARGNDYNKTDITNREGRENDT